MVTTKSDKKLRRLRRVKYRGTEVDISAHVKCNGRGRSYMRIHFYVDRERKLIVIGHCGDHLKTSGTRLMH